MLAFGASITTLILIKISFSISILMWEWEVAVDICDSYVTLMSQK